MKKSTLISHRQTALTIANKLKAEGYAFGEAQKIGWQIARLKEAMKNNVVLIHYLKKDGTDAERLATLNPALLPTPKATKKTATTRKRTSSKVSYYELSEEGNNWKSFLPQYLVSWSIAVDIKQVVSQTLFAAPTMTMKLQAA